MLVDAHCHPTDYPGNLESIGDQDLLIAAMSTQLNDLDLVADIATRFPDKVTPAFGLHPWFSHLVYTDEKLAIDKAAHYKRVLEPTPDDDHPILQCLPEPVSLKKYLSKIRNLFQDHPNALLGESGLDSKFKVKCDGVLYPFRVSMAHQRAVLRAQLDLARFTNRSASLHGVGASQALYDEVASSIAESVKNPKLGCLGPICLHSYSGSPEFYSQCWCKLPVKVYLSMTTLISDRLTVQRRNAWLSVTDPTLVLTESDFSRSDPFQIALVKSSLRFLAERFGWDEDQAEKMIERNYSDFIAPPPVP